MRDEQAQDGRAVRGVVLAMIPAIAIICTAHSGGVPRVMRAAPQCFEKTVATWVLWPVVAFRQLF